MSTSNLQPTLGHDSRVALLDPFDRLRHHLVNDDLRALLLVDHRRSLAHQERPRIIHRLIVDIVTHALQIGLDGDDALLRQILDVVLPVRLPVVDIRVGPHTQRTTSEDNRAHIVVEARRAHSLLVCFRCSSLLGKHKPSPDPDCGRTERHGSRQALAIVQTARSHDLHRCAGHWARVALAQRRDGRDEDRRRHIACVATTLPSLRADEIHAEVEALLDVLRVPDHVHVEDASAVEAVNDVLGRDADGRDEHLGAGVDDDADELVELALGVVVASNSYQ